MKCEAMADAPDPARRLAKEIRAARAYAGLSRAQLADEVGVKGDTIGRYERGEWTRPPGRLVLAAIAAKTAIPQVYLDAGFLAPVGPADRPASSGTPSGPRG